MVEASTPGFLKVDLHGQAALVTGASRGLGKSMALALAACGARVACIARDAGKLNETVSQILAAGGQATAFECDVTKAASVNPLVENIAETWGRIDILINNAGITRDGLLARMDEDDWDAVISTNLKGAYLFTKACIRPMMSARYGRIINVSSIAGVIGNPGQANYSASKAGLIGFTQTVAREVASRKITVNAVAPGFIESEMTAALGPLLEEEVKKRVPAKRIGTADEVANAVLYLVSPQASYVTGLTLVIDGGLTA